MYNIQMFIIYHIVFVSFSVALHPLASVVQHIASECPILSGLLWRNGSTSQPAMLEQARAPKHLQHP